MPRDATLTSFDGTAIAYRDYGGEGDGLVLLHGIGGNLESMDGLARLLGTQRRVVTQDARCCGQSGDSAVFSFDDAVTDIEMLAAALGLTNLAVAGASMGGVIAGHYGARHPESPIVSIDGFAAGVLPRLSEAEQEEFDIWAAGARQGLEAMTAPPEIGDAAWRDAQIRQFLTLLQQLDYRSPIAEREARRNYVALPNGQYRRHPTRQVLTDPLVDLPRRTMVHMFDEDRGRVLIIFCTQAGWPSALARELDSLVERRPNIRLVRLDASHTAPVWKEADRTARWILEFLGAS